MLFNDVANYNKKPPLRQQERLANLPDNDGMNALDKHIIPSLLWFYNQGIFIPFISYTQKKGV